MRVTVCELVNRDREAFEAAWWALAAHVVESDSELLLLPEMPFSRWLAAQPTVDAPRWAASVRAHEQRLTELPPLGAATLCSTRPVGPAAGQRFQQSVVRTPGGAFLQPTHRKCLLPEEPGWHESRWYRHGPREFLPIACGSTRLGFLVCTELWFTEHARAYGRDGAEVLLTPRATDLGTLDRWLAAGRVACIVAGAFGLSSNFSGPSESGHTWGGGGWVIDPNGEVLATTSRAQPFVTVDIDLAQARAARSTYPRYVVEP